MMVKATEQAPTAAPAPPRELRLPRPSAMTRALIYENWAQFDPDWPRFEAWLQQTQAVAEFGHARATFREHLRGTLALCAAWGLPQAAARAGLLHTAYSGDLFYFALARSEVAEDRAALRALVGPEAERLVHLFGAVHRGTIMDCILRTGEIPPQGLAVRWNRAADAALAGGPSVQVSAQDCALLMFVTVADYLEQAVASNAWKDIYQEDAPSSLWPGSGKPATCLHWLSKLSAAARPHLPAGCSPPPIFAGCTETLDEETETHARDLYWSVVRAEDDPGSMDDAERLRHLNEAVRLNPYVGEPHVLMAQIASRQGDNVSAVAHCAQALDKLYTLGTAWDKRIGFPGWCTFTRLVALRAARRADGAAPPHDFPRMPNGLAHIDEMLAEVKALEA